MDSRLKYPAAPSWNKQGKTQKLLGTELISIQANTPSSTLYEFELPNTSVLLFGPLCGFKITGVFEGKDAATNAVPSPPWEMIPKTDYDKLVVQPNWFDHLVKSVDVFHNNTKIKSHDVPRPVDAFVNTYVHGLMDSTIKKCLCPEACNPGNAVPKLDKKWSTTANSQWHEYSKTIFGTGTLVFRYIPPFVFPFYQQSNFCGHGRPPAALPMPLLEKMTISLSMHEDTSNIFKKSAANTKEYRFRIRKVELVVEAARLNPTFEKSFLSQKGNLHFSGVTKFSLTENINSGTIIHRTRFQDIPYPEGVFIFAVPKSVLSGQFKYSTVADTAGEILQKHNIDSINIQFQNKSLALKSPNIYGNLSDHIVEIKQYIDHMEHPPFGVLQELDQLTLETIKEGGKDSIFPHYYVNLCPSGPETRVIPIGDDGSSINKPGDLDIEIKFVEEGSKDVTYFVYVFYTDVAFVLDLKSREFVSMYKRARPNN